MLHCVQCLAEKSPPPTNITDWCGNTAEVIIDGDGLCKQHAAERLQDRSSSGE